MIIKREVAKAERNMMKCRKWTQDEVKDTLGKIKKRKQLGPDSIMGEIIRNK